MYVGLFSHSPSFAHTSHLVNRQTPPIDSAHASFLSKHETDVVVGGVDVGGALVGLKVGADVVLAVGDAVGEALGAIVGGAVVGAFVTHESQDLAQ